MAKTKHAINEKALLKGEVRKLTALRKSLGAEIADKAFSEWYGQRDTGGAAKADPNISAIQGALQPLLNTTHFPRGGGYAIKRGRGRFLVEPLS